MYPTRNVCAFSINTVIRLMLNDELIVEDGIGASIAIRGPTVMQGYLDNPEATNAAIDEEGWLMTGDVAYRYHDKYYIVDREKVRLHGGMFKLNINADELCSI